ncbi:hypothetical protein OAH18_00940 [bacterium]|nr:hypothetical protein [bacterium]
MQIRARRFFASALAAVRAFLKRPVAIRLLDGVIRDAPEGVRSTTGRRGLACFATLRSQAHGIWIFRYLSFWQHTRAWAAHDVVIPWTEAMIKLRLPKNADPRKGSVKLLPVDLKQGWLADVRTGKFAAFEDQAGIASETSWFPDENVAKAWASYSFPKTKVQQ